MSLTLDDDGASGLAREESRASIASLGSIAHSEAPTRKSEGSLLAVKTSVGGGESGGGRGEGLLNAPSLKALAELPTDELTLKTEKSSKKGPSSIRSSLAGSSQALVVDLKPTPGSTPLKTPSLRKGPGSEYGLEASPPTKGSEGRAVNFGGHSSSPSVRSSSARHRSPTKEERPDATQHIDYDANTDS